jgi:hypothetical protein
LRELLVAKAPDFPLQDLPKEKFDALFQGIFRLQGLKWLAFHTCLAETLFLEAI